jgi:SAM-dependent methyltransferase
VQGASGLRGSKEEVRRFYEEVGWLRGEETGAFVDAERFEDLRDVTGDYIRRCHLRVNRYLAPAGDFLLDVASGPVQYDEYLTYSQGYGKRLCIDISFRALEKAKERLGDRGAYVLGDITNLPLRDGTVDGAVSLHTIFHVPRDEQHLALKELHRVLRPGRSAVVVYSWGGHSLAMKFALSPLRLLALPYYGARRLLRTLRPRPNADAATAEPRLYFFAHPPDYFWRARWPFRLRLRVWRSVSVEFTRTFAHDGFCGRALLAALFWLEERAPRAAGLVGQYPLLWIVKEGAGAISATARGTLAAPR